MANVKISDLVTVTPATGDLVLLSQSGTTRNASVANIRGVVNDVTTGGTDKALSAEQGKGLSNKIGDLTTSTNTNKTSVVNITNELNASLSDYTKVNSYLIDTGSANAYVITPSPAITSYVAGQVFRFKAINANTGASTVSVNGLGIKAIKKNVSSDLGVGDISAGQIITVIHDGTNFQLISGGKIVSNKSSSLGTTGYRYNDDGTIEQWGVVSITTGTTVTFPIAFPTACYNVFLVAIGTGPVKVAHYSESTTQVTLYHDSGTTSWIEWRAIGK